MSLVVGAAVPDQLELTVVSLQVAPEHRAALTSVPYIDVEAGRGVVGDRYYGTKHRHISVQSAQSLADASHGLGRTLDSASTRRTVTVSGGTIPSTPGARMLLGSVEVEVVRIAAPCRLMDEINGEGARRALHTRGGSVCRVLSTGTVRLGDVVRLDA